MILDKQNLFSDAQAVTASAASTNYINLGQREVAFGTPIDLLIQVVEDFATCTSLTISVQTDDEITFTSPVTLASTPAIPVADLIEGYRPSLKYMPSGNLGYVRLYYTIAGSNATAGKITAGFVAAMQEGHHQLPSYVSGT